MIHDRTKRLIAYRSALPGVDRALHLVEKQGLQLADAFEQMGVEVRRKQYATRADDARRFEVHDHTIDLMVAFAGSEVIHLCAPDELRPGDPLPDGADGRKLVGAPRGLAVTLEAGHFVAIFPGEAHMVGGHTLQGPGHIDKLVIKLPMAPLEQDTCPCTDTCVRHGTCRECVVWHRNPHNSLPSCLREKGRILIRKALEEQAPNTDSAG